MLSQSTDVSSMGNERRILDQLKQVGFIRGVEPKKRLWIAFTSKRMAYQPSILNLHVGRN